MVKKNRFPGIEERMPSLWSAQSEPESHIEHQAALDATIFKASGDPYELVLELDAGELRVRRPRRD